MRITYWEFGFDLLMFFFFFGALLIQLRNNFHLSMPFICAKLSMLILFGTRHRICPGDPKYSVFEANNLSPTLDTGLFSANPEA
jgi:hypothetical protein